MLREILLFTADDGNVRALTAAGEFLTDYTLSDLDTRTGARFIRTSRAELVNMDHVARVETAASGTLTLRLSNARLVSVSRRRIADVKAALEG